MSKGEITISQRHPLSQTQIEGLRKSPHVEYVTEKTVSFTAAFKEHAHREIQAGKPLYKILKEAGIAPELLGKRLNSLRTNLKRQGERNGVFTDIHHKNISAEAPRTNEDKIARLEHELAYTKQEVEFLKKIYLADREAQKSCDTRRRRKPNSESSEK